MDNNLRRLGWTEQFLWRIDKCASLNFVIVAKVTGQTFDKDLLTQAFAASIRRHPFLGVVVAADEVPTFMGANRSAPVHVFEEGDVSWHKVVEDELNSPFREGDQSLARLAVVRGSEESHLILTLHHSISDGTSGPLAMAAILESVSALVQGREPFAKHGAVPASLEEAIRTRIRGLKGLFRLFVFVVRNLLSLVFRKPRRLVPAALSSQEHRRTRVRPEILEPNATRALVERCREERTTVHGAICAAVLQATAEIIRSEQRRTGPIQIWCGSPVDMRRGLGLEPSVACYVSGITTSHRISPDAKFWDLARDVRDRVRRATAREEALLTLPLQARMLPKGKAPDETLRKIERNFPIAVAVTNIGRVDLPEHYGALTLRQVHFAGPASPPGNPLVIAVATFRDLMSLDFVHVEPSLAADRIDPLIDRVIQLLQEAAIGPAATSAAIDQKRNGAPKGVAPTLS